MNNKNYWQNRFEQLQESLLKPADDYINELENAYNQAQRSIEKDIALWYQRFADNNGITDMAEAKRLLKSNELKEFKWDVYEYIKYGKENAISQKWVKELENASAKVHIDRLETIKIQARQAMEKLYSGLESNTNKIVKNTYKDSYYKTAFETANETGIYNTLSGIDNQTLEKIAKKPWASDKINFSERIWGYKTESINLIYDELTKGIISGKTVDEMSKSLSKAARVKESYARRLVLTETAYFSSLGSKECFEKLNVKRYEIIGTLDKNTCEKCGNLDKKVYDLEEFEIGVTAPPFHCNCRCTTAPYFDDEFTEDEERFARDENGKRIYVDSNMSYKDWKKKFVDNNDTNTPQYNNENNNDKQKSFNFDENKIKDKINDILEKSDISKNHKYNMQYYISTAEFEDRTDINGAFAYMPEYDIIAYNKLNPHINSYDLDYAIIHELTHRADILMYKSVENEEFRQAIIETKKTLMERKEEIQAWFVKGGKYKNDFAFSDIIYILSDGKIDTFAGHKNISFDVEIMEIFANISCIDIMNLDSKDELKNVLGKLYYCYLKIIGGAL